MAVVPGGRNREGVSGRKAFQRFLRDAVKGGTSFTASGTPRKGTDKPLVGEELMLEQARAGYKVGNYRKRNRRNHKPRGQANGPCSGLVWNEKEGKWVPKHAERRTTLGRRTRMAEQAEVPSAKELEKELHAAVDEQAS